MGPAASSPLPVLKDSSSAKTVPRVSALDAHGQKELEWLWLLLHHSTAGSGVGGRVATTILARPTAK